MILVVLTSVVPATAAQTHIQIQSVNVSEDNPAPGERVTLTTTIANFESSAGPVEVTDVYVRRGAREFSRIGNPGSIAVGGSLTVPLNLKFDETGFKRLTVHATVEQSNGEYRQISYPLYLDVEEPDEALISVSNLNPVAGQKTPVNVTISNGDTEPLSNAQLYVDGAATVDNPERVTASLAPGTQSTYTFQTSFPEAGSQTLNATLSYQTSSGSTRTVQRTVDVSVDEAMNDVELDASNQIRNGSSVIRTEIHQFGNVELKDVEIRAMAEGRTVARVPVENVLGESSRVVTLRDDEIPAGNVTIVAAFTAQSERQTTTSSLRYAKYAPAPTSSITLTGIEITRQGDTLTLDGDAANVGTSQVNSVVVSVVETNTVKPVDPQREFFIERINPSEFERFEATANASAGVQELPVRVQYTVAGQRISTIVPVDASNADVQANTSENGESSFLGVGAFLLVVAVAVGGVYRWWNR